jgi:uncharacterized protein (TIGR00299 family) protein
MTTAYFDCFSGAAGDMIVGALVDAGADATVLQERLTALPVAGYHLSFEKIAKQGFASTKFVVDLDQTEKQPHRHLKHIVQILDESSLSESVKDKTKAIFTRLAEAEAKVHGSTIEKVHFHEVGAVDAIVDVTGAVIALELLGVDRVLCSEVPVGSGTVKCDHGIMPVPAPATAELLRGVPIAACEEPGELTTPTGAAILTALSESFGPMPAMTINAIGFGAGTRDGKTRPNVLRVMLGESAEIGEVDEIVSLEANLDDMTPEVLSFALDRLLAGGALDVYTQPILMKKGRSAWLLTVLAEPAQVAALERIMFAETTTFGVRRSVMRRSKLSRRQESVETPYGAIRMKIGERGDVVTVAPEYEDCRAAAEAVGASLQDVMASARIAWSQKGA